MDNLGMSYGISGDNKKAKEVFEYGLSKDGAYPLFYYNLACAHAEMNDLDNAIKNLRLAFSYKANMIPGEQMPDPAGDDSFARFLSNPQFRKLLEEISSSLHSAVVGQRNSWEDYIKAGDSAIAQARSADAESAYREALKLSEKFEEKDQRRVLSLIKLAECLNSQSKGEEAAIFAQRSLSALDKAISGSKPKDLAEEYYRTEATIMTLNKAADIFLANQKYAEAESTYRRAIAIREEGARTQEAPKSNEDYLKFAAQVLNQARAKSADAYDRLAKLYFVQKRFKEAERLYGKSTKVLEAEYGAKSPVVATSLSNLAVVYAAQDKYDMAEKVFARAVKIYEQSNWLDKPEIATTFENYSLLLKKTGRQAEASVMLERARQVRAKLH